MQIPSDENRVVREDGTINNKLMIFKAKYHADPDTRKVVEYDEKSEEYI